MKLELKILSLLVRNIGKEFTINGIAIILDEYYSLVHRTITTLAKENIIMIKRIGKSNICSINLKNEKTIALLQLSEIEMRDELYLRNKKLKLILEDFEGSARILEPISIVLFGSYAKDIATKDSDIDILLISKSGGKVDRITKDIYAKYGNEINVLLMTPTEFKKQRDRAIIKEIIKSHYTLYGIGQFIEAMFK